MRPIQRIVETALCVDDLNAAEAFYRDVLEFEGKGNEAGRHVFFRVGADSVLLLFSAENTRKGELLPPHGTSGAGHVAFGVGAEELDQWRRKLESKGVAIEHEQVWSEGVRSIYFRDPSGNLLELITPGLWGLPSGW
ncbi:fosfomycin resistance protein FosB [Planctomycetes bacterium Pan216]|uniref:Fosfomycin resistance protein FosB n=1 Tax=Kolteria novifilia TaxID=2527975 RepID=A0A518B526_9BACT|nr:fosfomycin resistance protein FosB [Planctomycetes bacterium Pan216]